MAAEAFALDDRTIAGIRADVDAYERERAAVQSGQRWRVPLFLAIVAVLVVVLAVAFNAFADAREQWVSAPHVFLYVAGFAGAALAYVAATRPARRFEETYRERFFVRLFKFTDELRYRHDETPESFERLPREAIGDFNRKSFDDIFSGRYDGFPFELYEAEFGTRGGATLFKGIIAAFETAVPFDGMLVATGKAAQAQGLFRGFFGAGLEPIESGIASIDATYEFRTDNPQAAQPLVQGNLPRALEWLAETWPEGQARVALSGIDGFLLLPLSKNFFELPPASEPLDFGRDAEPMLRDMAALLATAALVRKVGAQ